MDHQEFQFTPIETNMQKHQNPVGPTRSTNRTNRTTHTVGFYWSSGCIGPIHQYKPSDSIGLCWSSGCIGPIQTIRLCWSLLVIRLYWSNTNNQTQLMSVGHQAVLVPYTNTNHQTMLVSVDHQAVLVP